MPPNSSFPGPLVMATPMPFLYRTRTMKRPLYLPALRVFFSTSPAHAEGRQLPRHRRVLLPPAPPQSNPKPKKILEDWIPFDIPEDVPAGPPPGFEEDERSTITVSERKTFERIFQEIAIRGKFGDLSKPAKKARQHPLKPVSPMADAAVDMLMNPDVEDLIPDRAGDVDRDGELDDMFGRGGQDGTITSPEQQPGWGWDDINVTPGSAAIRAASSSTQRPRDAIGTIFDGAAKAEPFDQVQQNLSHGSPTLGQTVDGFSQHKELMRFPQTLRGAAQKAMRVFERSAAASAAPSSSWDNSGRQKLMDSSQTPIDPQPAQGLVLGPSKSASVLGGAMRRGKQAEDLLQAGGEDQEKRHDPLWDVFASGDNPLAQSLMTTTMRLQERTRVERRMFQASHDFALWDIMEEEVFSLPRRMGLEDSASYPNTVEDVGPQSPQKPSRVDWHEVAISLPSSAGKRKARKPRKSQAETQLAPKQPDEDKPCSPRPELDIRTFGPLYSSHLLFGLRRLDQAFDQSSPLALAILPRVKQLGLVSYVLGASTPFYNALMRLHFYRYGDITAVLNLLEEMGYAGLYMDQTSLALIKRAKYALVRYMQGGYGPFLQAVMSQPEFDYVLMQRLMNWEQKIRSSIRDRAAALGS